MIEVMISENEIDGDRKRLCHLCEVFLNGMSLRNVTGNEYDVGVFVAQFPHETDESGIVQEFKMNIC